MFKSIDIKFSKNKTEHDLNLASIASQSHIGTLPDDVLLKIIKMVNKFYTLRPIDLILW